jgi:NADPH2:quinone reductase
LNDVQEEGMKAAIIDRRGQPPRYGEFADPEPREGYTAVRVLAAGLHPIVKALAAGGHYGSTGGVPCVPGVDGVGRLPDGRRAYIGFAPAPYGTFSERTLAPAGVRGVALPDELDDATVAGFLNPAMAAWLALAVRAELLPGENVLVLGATGVAGRLVVQFARHLGAGGLVAAGRDPGSLATLPTLGADRVIDLGEPTEVVAEAVAASSADVVVDFLWGAPAEVTLGALARRGLDNGARRVRYVQIGETAGAELTLRAASLRSTGVEILGSGAGSVPIERIMAEMPRVLKLAADGSARLDVETVPLADVADAWQRETHGRRLVVVP